MASYASVLRGWCAAVLVGFGAPLRMSGPADNTEEKLREYGVPDETPSPSEVAFDRQRWSPHGWLRPRSRGQRAYFDIHIPKTAGSSFALDVKKLLPEGEGYFSTEMCFNNATRKAKLGDGVVAFLRDPVDHVFSQFLECKYDDWGKAVVQPQQRRSILRDVTTWLRHFDGGREKDDLQCYHPYNMQTRALTCNSSCHHLESEPSVGEALQRLDSLYFVGLTERYHASVCLFVAKARPQEPLPSFCNCTDTAAWSSFRVVHIRHHAPPHRTSELSEAEVGMIQQLTKYDAQLYARAKARFEREALDVERARGMKILCYD